jgi:hypothetical protein
MVHAHAGLRNDSDYLRERLSRDVRYVVRYALKGSDADKFRNRMPVTLPRRLHGRQAGDWIVWARGITWRSWDAYDQNGFPVDLDDHTTVDLGDVIESRYANASMPVQKTEHREPMCRGCDRPLSPVHNGYSLKLRRVHRGGRTIPAPVRMPRRDRRYCTDCDRRTVHRERRRILSIIGRQMREAVMVQPLDLP